MKPWKKYIKDVNEGNIVTCNYIKQAVARFERMCADERYWFDEKAVIEVIDFIQTIKLVKGEFEGRPFILENWQCFILACIYGIKKKGTNKRVCREAFIFIARKAGKDQFLAAICLYEMIMSGEKSPEVACLANSREQASILFDFIKRSAQSIDPKGSVVDYYKNYIATEFNHGICKTYSSDSSKLDGLSISLACIDEFHEANDRKLYDVMKSSQGARSNPLMVVISTAGYHEEGPCHDMYMLGIEILSGVKEDDSFMPFMFCLDEDDKPFEDDSCWIKCQPNLGVSCSYDFMESEVRKAKNDPTALNSVMVKTFNRWTQSYEAWIPQEKVVKCMQPVDLKDYEGCTAYIGVDLSAVQDLTAMSVMIPNDDGKMIFKTWHWLPRDTFENSPNKELYRKFIQEGSLILTNGGVVDYDAIIIKMNELNECLNIAAIGYDKWNSTQWAINCANLGYNMQEFSQAIGNYNACTKDMAKRVLNQECIIDKSSCVLWEFGNVVIKSDANGNQKPNKDSGSKKIDGIISMTTSLGIFLKNNADGDYEIFVI